jgi:hypothetical protein
MKRGAIVPEFYDWLGKTNIISIIYDLIEALCL